MKNLYRRRLHSLHSAISKLDSGIEPGTLPARTIESISEIIFCDNISFGAFAANADFLATKIAVPCGKNSCMVHKIVV